MTQRRSTQTGAWAQAPATWFALAAMFVAISMPQWVLAVREGRVLAYVAAVGFVVAALAFLVQARRCARQRSRD